MRADQVLVIVLWLIVFKVTAWTAVAIEFGWIGQKMGLFLGVGIVPLTGLVCVLHVRLYVVRVCSLIRASARIERGNDAQVVRPLR